MTKGRPNVIAILASAEQHAAFQWSKVGVDLHAIINDVLNGLVRDLKMKELKPGNISLAGHSAGGEALGLATESAGDGKQDGFGEDNIHEVTVQEGGYGFPSFSKLAKWFLKKGAAPKKIRVISVASHDDFLKAPGMFTRAQAAYEDAKAAYDKDPSDANKKARDAAAKNRDNAKNNLGSTATRNASEGGGLSLAALSQQIKLLNPKLAVASSKGEATKRPDGLLLESTIEVTGDGERKIEIFHDTNHGHFDVRNHTTTELLSGSL